jgi:pimeloyl-ACP methyl ester carboxylesterase
VPVNGVRLAYLEAGRGEPVLFIHGALGDYRNWSHQMAPFAREYRVLALSRRYHWPNRWTDDGRSYTFEQQLADIVAVIGRLHLAPVHLVGHSYGANLAFMLALRYPELVRDVVLAEPVFVSLFPAGPALDSMLASGRRAMGGVAQQFIRGDTAAAVRDFMRWAIGPLDIPAADPDGWRRLLQNAASLAAQLTSRPGGATERPLSCADAHALTRPALIVEGDQSPAEMRQAGAALAGCVPGLRRAHIARASHAMFIDNPDDFNAAVMGFFRR